MSNQLFSSFFFQLSYLGDPAKADGAFQEVSGLSVEMTTEEVACGGENRFKYQLPNIPKHQNLVLKRGVWYGDSKLRQWCTDSLNGNFIKTIYTQDLQLKLYNEKQIPAMTWNVYGAYPVKMQASELHSEKSQLMIETIEMAYRYFDVEISESGNSAGEDPGFGNLFG